jgi:hypothetical protein
VGGGWEAIGICDEAEVRALEAGFRLRCSGTLLWFNVGAEQWSSVRRALVALGAELGRGGLEGEEVCTASGLLVSYHPGHSRMQAEVEAGGGRMAAACLAALRQVAPAPAAEASPVWLWSPEPFQVGAEVARPAVRVIRAARWVLPRSATAAVVEAAGEAAAGLDARGTLELLVAGECELRVTTASAVVDGMDAIRRADLFAALLRRLGRPRRVEYVTHGE